MNGICEKYSCLRNKQRVAQLEEENARLKSENLQLRAIHESIKVLLNSQEVQPTGKEGMEPDTVFDSNKPLSPNKLNCSNESGLQCNFDSDETRLPDDFEDRVQHVLHYVETSIMCPTTYDNFEELNCVNASTPAHKSIISETEEDPDETRLPENLKDLDDARFDFLEKENETGEPAITSFDRLPSRQQQNSKFAYKAKLPRKRSERMQLPGQTCNDCENAYDLLELTGKERERMINRCSRHRGPYKRTRSPPGFWDLDQSLMKQNR